MKKCKDLTGVKFGRLTALERVENNAYGGIRWRCICDCGNEKVVLSYSLTSGCTKSCGCYNREKVSGRSIKDLTAQRFGRLIAIRIQGKTKAGQCIWLCQCDCGKLTAVRSPDLVSGNTKSCGCYWLDVKRKPFGEAALNSLYGLYKRQAKYRGHEFALSKDDFKRLIFDDCCYCGKHPMQQHIATCNGYVPYNGLDRVDNNKGYTLDNVVPCCGQCNTAKSDYSVNNFKTWLKHTYEHLHLENYESGGVLHGE